MWKKKQREVSFAHVMKDIEGHLSVPSMNTDTLWIFAFANGKSVKVIGTVPPT